jgi:hypothetical protein
MRGVCLQLHHTVYIKQDPFDAHGLSTQSIGMYYEIVLIRQGDGWILHSIWSASLNTSELLGFKSIAYHINRIKMLISYVINQSSRLAVY